MENFISQETLESLSFWLFHYGSLSLFILLALGIVALPVPEETLMVLVGIFLAQDKLPIVSTLIAAYGGAICGITTSYGLGRSLGHYLVVRFGKYVGLSSDKMLWAHNWFERFGKWTLIIGYFVPGLRHFTGFIAGVTELIYHEFALFAYSGAILWVSTFIAMGYFLGDHIPIFLKYLEGYADEAIILALSLFIVIVAWLLYRRHYR